jgi:ABC-type uncharacterized transport system involved in gliding motility auxiliary subunit
MGVDTPKAWNKLIEPFGVSMNQDVIVDPRVQQPPLGVLTKNYSSAVEIVKSFSQPTFFTFSSSLKTPTQPLNPKVKISSFVSSESITYSKAGDLNSLRSGIGKKSGDLQGPHSIGVLIEEEGDKKPETEKQSSFDLFPKVYAQESAPNVSSKPVAVSTTSNSAAPAASIPSAPLNKGIHLIVFSNYHFAMNALIQQFANLDLLVSSVNYLLEDKDVIGIRPREASQARLELTDKNIYQVRGYIVLAACLFVTLGVWATRRRRSA